MYLKPIHIPLCGKTGSPVKDHHSSKCFLFCCYRLKSQGKVQAMAYRRSLTTSAKLLTRQRFAPSFSCTHHEDDCNNSHSDEKVKSFLQSRSYGNNTNSWLGFGSGMSFLDPKGSQFLHVTSGFLLARHMSTTNVDGDGEEKIECMADKTMEVVSKQATAVNEVAVAAADSWPPVAALQYAIDGIHIYTGLNWWASIVITTLVIRTLSIPLMINQLKATSKLTSLRPELGQIKQEMQDRGMSPTDVAEGQERMKKIFKEHGVSYFTPLKGLFIQGPVFVSLFLAIQNMVEKVPSLQTGGISWFIDLTTADSYYILPCLAAFSFWVTVESNMRQGFKANPSAVTMKNVSRGLCALTVPLAACFPNALLCYWITSNFFSLVYGLIIRKPSVKKLLNIPVIEGPPTPFPTGRSSLASALEALTKDAAAKAMQQRQGETKPTITNQSITSPSLLSMKPTSQEHESNYK